MKNIVYKKISIIMLMAVINPLSAIADNKFLSATLKNDYVFRGITQTSGDGSGQVYGQYQHDSGVLLGSFISNVDYGDGTEANAEIDFILGHAGKTKSYWWDVKYINFVYQGQSEFNFDELRFKAGFDKIASTVGYTDSWAGSGDVLTYFELAYSDQLFEYYKVRAHIGISKYKDNTVISDYDNYLLSISRNIYGVNYSITGTSTSDDLDNDIAGDRIVFGVGYVF